MFENCNTLDDLNRSRIEAIKNGELPVIVNKAYAKRKALILDGQTRGFKKLIFIKKPVPVAEDYTIGFKFDWDDDDQYKLYVEV